MLRDPWRKAAVGQGLPVPLLVQRLQTEAAGCQKEVVIAGNILLHPAQSRFNL